MAMKLRFLQILGRRFNSVMPSNLFGPGAMAVGSVPCKSAKYAGENIREELRNLYKRSDNRGKTLPKKHNTYSDGAEVFKVVGALHTQYRHMPSWLRKIGRARLNAGGWHAGTAATTAGPEEEGPLGTTFPPTGWSGRTVGQAVFLPAWRS